MDITKITQILVSEIKLSEIQSKIFLHIVINGKMKTSQIANDLNISSNDAYLNS